MRVCPVHRCALEVVDDDLYCYRCGDVVGSWLVVWKGKLLAAAHADAVMLFDPELVRRAQEISSLTDREIRDRGGLPLRVYSHEFRAQQRRSYKARARARAREAARTPGLSSAPPI